jgi:translation elongation factor EF-G
MDAREPAEKLRSLGNSLAFELSDCRNRQVFETALAIFHRAGLEPILEVKIFTPEDFLGDVIGCLNSRNAIIKGAERRGDAQLIEAQLPLSNLFGFDEELRTNSQGRSHWTAQFLHFDQLAENGGPPDTEPSVAALRA